MLTEEQVRPHIVVDDDGNEWVPAQVARYLVPARTPGKVTQVSTLKDYWKRGLIDRARCPCRANTTYYRLDQLRALTRIVRDVPGGKLEGVAPAPVRESTERTLERMTRSMAPTRELRAPA